MLSIPMRFPFSLRDLERTSSRAKCTDDQAERGKEGKEERGERTLHRLLRLCSLRLKHKMPEKTRESERERGKDRAGAR